LGELLTILETGNTLVDNVTAGKQLLYPVMPNGSVLSKMENTDGKYRQK